VAHVAEAADALRERIDALERELTGMLGTLRGGADRLRSELDAVAEGTARLAAASDGAAPAEIAPTALGATVGEAAAAEPADEEVGEEPALAAVEEASERSTDVIGARMVALQWAMEGRTRDETERHLAEHFDLPDRAAVLEVAYARAAKT
jgi:hypothetical protein